MATGQDIAYFHGLPLGILAQSQRNCCVLHSVKAHRSDLTTILYIILKTGELTLATLLTETTLLTGALLRD